MASQTGLMMQPVVLLLQVSAQAERRVGVVAPAGAQQQPQPAKLARASRPSATATCTAASIQAPLSTSYVQLERVVCVLLHVHTAQCVQGHTFPQTRNV